MKFPTKSDLFISRTKKFDFHFRCQKLFFKISKYSSWCNIIQQMWKRMSLILVNPSLILLLIWCMFFLVHGLMLSQYGFYDKIYRWHNILNRLNKSICNPYNCYKFLGILLFQFWWKPWLNAHVNTMKSFHLEVLLVGHNLKLKYHLITWLTIHVKLSIRKFNQLSIDTLSLPLKEQLAWQ